MVIFTGFYENMNEEVLYQNGNLPIKVHLEPLSSLLSSPFKYSIKLFLYNKVMPYEGKNQLFTITTENSSSHTLLVSS